jgi:hypothetical protein
MKKVRKDMKYYYKIGDKEFEMIPIPKLHRLWSIGEVESFPSMLALYRRIILRKCCALSTKSDDNEILTIKRLSTRVRKLEWALRDYQLI